MYTNLISFININIAKKQYILNVKNTKSNLCFLNTLLRLNYISIIKKTNSLTIIYINFKILKKIKNFYKPSNYKYIKYKSLLKINSIGVNYIFIISTSLGLLTLNETVQKKLGGILVCVIY